MNLNRFKFVVLLAKRDIFEEKRISLIVVVMLGFSYLNLVFFPGFISGLSYTFTEQIIDGRTGHVAIEQEGMIENADSLEKKISRLEGVEDTEKVLTFSATATYDNKSVLVDVRGTSAYDLESYRSKMVSGDFLSKSRDEAVVGRFLTRKGDVGKIRGIGIERGRIIGLDIGGETRNYKVRGVIGTEGGIGGLSQKVIVPFHTAEDILGVENRADKIRVFLDERTDSVELKNELKALNVQGEIETWRQLSTLAKAIKSTFGIVVNIVSLVGLIIALGAIGVVIYINTQKRMREMGIVRAIGARKATVAKIFVLEALILGFLGVVIGNLLAMGIDSYLMKEPVESAIGPIGTDLTPGLLWERSILMMVASMVAGVIPSYQISKTEIVSTIENR